MSPAQPRQAANTERPRGLHFAVALANAAHPAVEWAGLASAHGDTELGACRVDSADLARAVAEIRAVFAITDNTLAATALNLLMASSDSPGAMVGTAAGPRGTELTQLENGRWALRPRIAAAETAAAVYRAVTAFALAERLAERGRCAWGVCAAETCTNVFVDEGRRAPQRFCSTPCATRTRVAAHRRASSTTNGEARRHAKAASPEAGPAA